MSDRKVLSNCASIMVSGRRRSGGGGNAEEKIEPDKDGGRGDASKSKKHRKIDKHHKKNTRERRVGPSAPEMQRQDLRGALHCVPPEGKYAGAEVGETAVLQRLHVLLQALNPLEREEFMNTHNLQIELRNGISGLATAAGTTGADTAEDTNAKDCPADSDEANKEEIVPETLAGLTKTLRDLRRP